MSTKLAGRNFAASLSVPLLQGIFSALKIWRRERTNQNVTSAIHVIGVLYQNEIALN